MLFFALLACNTKHPTILSAQKEIKNDESAIKIEAFSTNSLEASIISLQGVWEESEVGNALFYIKRDSLYYVEDQDDPIQIKLVNDTLFLLGDLPVYCKIIKFTNDSLWYIDQFSTIPTKLNRRK